MIYCLLNFMQYVTTCYKDASAVWLDFSKSFSHEVVKLFCLSDVVTVSIFDHCCLGYCRIVWKTMLKFSYALSVQGILELNNCVHRLQLLAS